MAASDGSHRFWIDTLSWKKEVPETQMPERSMCRRPTEITKISDIVAAGAATAVAADM
jgi:hypothetical protein